MKIIDCHVHPLFEDEELKLLANKAKVDFSLKGLTKEMKENKVERIVAISIHNEENNRFIESLAKENKYILPVYFVDVLNITKKSLQLLESSLREKKFSALKLTPGGQYFYPNEKRCKKIYRIAEKYRVPVIIHSGDPFYSFAKAKYTNPIYIDDVAVEHPNLKIVIAHSGNPWFEDAAEVAYKNENVFLDLSGWFTGKVESSYAKIIKNKVEFLFSYLEGCEKILYGTDWPIIRMKPYINFIKSLGLENYELRKIFYKNALKVFWCD
ncbi:MAG: amidohydrolase family protein [Candidatus Aenigmatarchaeota archaeon]